ncbi:hypothetical protein N7476_000365 [Penicillium atrosanguineum]|uniref:Myb-like domain-containing protein n=1 Tax=Penicillium atrosanguineum TaxID=1132637 RepID=A0A9W9QBE5_9EURO|nr:hypothetical protein N7476_000365 [Penicillium atrosanguineum]
MHDEPRYKTTQGSASWGPNAPMLFESSPHHLKLGQTSPCNTRSLPGPAELATEPMTGLSSKGQHCVSRSSIAQELTMMHADQVNSHEDLAQHTGRNVEIMPGLTTVGDNGAAVGNPEPCNSPDVKAVCDIQPANDALNFQTEVSRDVVEAENRDIASVTGDNQENNDPPTEEKAPCDKERRRLSIDESCAAFPDSTSLARPVSPLVRTGERSSPLESPQEITEDSSRQKRTATRYDGRSKSQSHQTFASRPQNSCVGKRKLPSNIASDHSSDDSDDPDDRDYVESRTKSQRRKPFSRPAKQARRSVTRVAPARAISNESLPLSNADAGDSEISEEQEFPTSLRDTETIAVSGFLTRQIFLSRVVYSFTFQEQREQSCSNERTKGPRANDKEVHEESSKKSKARKPKANNASTGARVLSEDDLLLIKLKEKGDLSWNQIAQHFPGRSKGALQVRYCTRLKNRTEGGSGHTRSRRKRPAARRKSSRTSYPVPQLRFMNSESPGPNNLPSQRYGPPRARRVVDRYSPV